MNLNRKDEETRKMNKTTTHSKLATQPPHPLEGGHTSGTLYRAPNSEPHDKKFLIIPPAFNDVNVVTLMLSIRGHLQRLRYTHVNQIQKIGGPFRQGTTSEFKTPLKIFISEKTIPNKNKKANK